MSKILVDLGVNAVGTLSTYRNPQNKYQLTILAGPSVDDGVYTPPQHIFINHVDLRKLYDALKGMYEPTTEGDQS